MKKLLSSATCALLLTVGLVSPVTTHPVMAATSGPSQEQIATAADAVIKNAVDLIGKATYSTSEYKKTYPYKFSCATFVDFVFKKSGIDLATYNEDYMMKQGVAVSKDQLQKGDLVFFDANPSDSTPSDHVGIYMGDNKMIHMADPQQNIVISDIVNGKAYYRDNYVTARRVIPSFLPSNPPTTADQVVSFAYSLQNKVTIGSTNNEATLTFTNPGFANYIYKKQGVTLGSNLASEQMKVGTAVAKSNLKKGDLVFFSSSIGSTKPSVVGIYAGNHVVIVPNSSNGFQTRVLFVDWYKDRYLTARRVINSATQTEEPTETQQPTPTPTPTDQPTQTEQPAPTNAVADQVVALADSLMGKATFGYTYNESTYTFTGAGFTYYVYSKNGIDLQYKLASRQAQMGEVVAKDQLQKGDIIFFSLNNSGTDITHAGIYAGNNEVIHLKQRNGLIKESLSSDWAKQNYVTARRVIK